MTMSQSPDLNAVMDECRKFPGLFQSLHLATCNAAGEPEASYATYVEHDGRYYIYVSELSAHTANLAAAGRCSVLFIESEGDAKHLFARRRLTLQCAAIECRRDSPEFEPLLDKFVEKFGNFMGMLRKLADFHLYQLRPQSGGYVAGFAQAYTLEGDGLSQIRHRKDQGHRNPDNATAAAMDAVAP
jgi:putative heme iron utilization protein